MNKHSKRASAPPIPLPVVFKRGDVTLALHAILSGPLHGAGSEADVDAFTNLCCMSVIPDGTEDPKALVRSMSNRFLESVKLNLCHLVKSPVTARVAQFFFMEWCFRHGHLEEDWHWMWKSKNEGDLRYRERIPLRTISGFPN